jgi:hypothetical protein
MDTLIVAGIVVAGVVLGAWSWATLSWAGPMQPAILGFALLVLVMMIRAWLRGKAAREEGREASVGERFRVHPAEISVAVVGVLLCGLWSVPALRALMLPLASAQGAAVVAQALADTDMGVRVRACELLFEVGGGREKNLVRMLETRPKEAHACLKGANKRRPGSVTLTATKSMSLWTGRVLSEEDEAKVGQACELLEPIEEMSAVAGVNMSGVLWQCAGGAQLVGVRQCCANRLAARGSLKDQLGGPETNADIIMSSYGPVVRRMFGTGKGQDAALVAVSRSLADEANKVWAVRTGCELMRGQGEPVMSALAGLVVFVEADSTCYPKDKQVRLGFSSPTGWSAVCEQIIDKRLEKDAEKEVCAAMSRAQVSMAVLEAKRRMRLGRGAMEADMWAGSVSSAKRVKGYGVGDEDFFTEAQRDLARKAGFRDPSGQTVGRNATWGEMTKDGYSQREVLMRAAREMGAERQVERYLARKEGKERLEKVTNDLNKQTARDVIARAVKLGKQGDPSGMYSESQAEELRKDPKTAPLVAKPSLKPRRRR